MSRKTVTLAACLFMVAMVLSPFTGNATKSDGVVRLGWNQEPRTLNPMNYDTIEAGRIMRGLLYETLLTYDQKLNPAPMLAKSWNISQDGLVYTFKLASEVTWHDGQPLTSEDVAFTYRYVIDNKIGNYINYVKHIETIKTPDKHTLILKYKEPIASTLYDLCNVFVVAKHKWEKISGKEALTYENKRPLGSGPFAFDAWKKNSYLSFKANNEYWRKKPNVNQVIFTFFASRDPMVMSLKQGDIDVIGAELTPLAVKALSKGKAIKIAQAPNLYYKHICINSSTFGKGHPALRDARVRRALTMAVDKKRLVNLIHMGYARPGLSVVMDGTPYFFNKTLEPYPFDLEKASSLLEEAGWKDSDGDRIRDKDGKPLNIRLLVISRWPEEMRAAEMIRDWWKKIGVTLTLQSADGGTILAELFPDYKHDMYLWGFSGQPDPNYSVLIYLSSQLRKWNGAGYENPEYDALYEKQIRTVDREKRRELLYKMQEIHYRDCPSIVLYYMTALGAYRADRLEGFQEDIPGGIISHLSADIFTGVRFK